MDLAMDVDKEVQSQSKPTQQQQRPSSGDTVASSTPRPVVLPVSRVKTIMKTCPDTSMISQEAAVVVTKSTEHFIEIFTKEALKAHQEANSSSRELQYKDLSHLVQDGPDKWQFLKDIIPHKIVVRDYLEKLDRQKALENAKKT